MTKYDIKQSGADGVRVIGSVDWSPEDWDYQTSVAEVERLLAEVKDKGAVNGFKSVTEGTAGCGVGQGEHRGAGELQEQGEVIYDFVPTKVESSNPGFIGHLSDYLLRETKLPGTRSIWIMERNYSGD